jgi:hypothetical protein
MASRAASAAINAPAMGASEKPRLNQMRIEILPASMGGGEQNGCRAATAPISRD